MGHRYQIPGLAFLLIFLGSSGSAQANAAQPVEASKAGGIAENVRILNDLSHGVSWGERAAEANEAKLKAMNESFLDMTIEMINHEKQRRHELSYVLFWTKLSGYIAFIAAHLFLIFGFLLGGCELLRAYRLRKKGAAEQLEIQLNLEGAAIKGSLYGFLVFGVSLVFYFAYLRFVYPVTVVE